MEPENNIQATESKSRLHEVTPLSKYLAMIIFITAPFLGGWIGYELALVEVEETVVISELPLEAVAKDFPDYRYLETGSVEVSFSEIEKVTVQPARDGQHILRAVASPDGNFVYTEQGVSDDPHGGRMLFMYQVADSILHPLQFINDDEEYNEVDFFNSIFTLYYMIGHSAFEGWDSANYLHYKIESRFNSPKDGVGRVLYYKSISTSTPWILVPEVR